MTLHERRLARDLAAPACVFCAAHAPGAPVGATAANYLGQAGLNVVVVERDPTPYARARAISTDEEVLRCWQHAGLAETLKADIEKKRTATADKHAALLKKIAGLTSPELEKLDLAIGVARS